LPPNMAISDIGVSKRAIGFVPVYFRSYLPCFPSEPCRHSRLSGSSGRRVCPARLMASLSQTAFKKRLKCML